MAKIVTSPEKYVRPWSEHGVFLAGGISGCDDWQKSVCDRFSKELPDNVVISNPRREGTMDPTHEPSAREQIEWEFVELTDADSVIFWFPAGGPNPIALFELGKELVKAKARDTDTTLYIGVHPDNARRLDIEIQTRLMFPDMVMFNDLEAMVDSFIAEFED